MSKRERAISEYETPELTQAIATILDVFSGADGGLGFVSLCGCIRRLEEHSLTGSDTERDNANKVLAVVKQFGRLCKWSVNN